MGCIFSCVLIMLIGPPEFYRGNTVHCVLWHQALVQAVVIGHYVAHQRLMSVGHGLGSKSDINLGLCDTSKHKCGDFVSFIKQSVKM